MILLHFTLQVNIFLKLKMYVLVAMDNILTGQETTANTIAFALILLIQHPNTMERYFFV